MSSGVRSFRGRGGGGRSGSSHATNNQPSTSRASVSFVPPQQISEPPLSRSSRMYEQPTQQPPFAHSPIQEPHIPEAMHEEPEEEAAAGPMGEVEHMTLEDLLTTPGREMYLPILNPELVEGTTWFGRDEGRITRKVSKLLKHKFDGPYYSWSKVPPRRQDRYFIDFAQEYTWDPLITTLVRRKYNAICINRMKDMVSKVRHKDRPKWIGETLWLQMQEYWTSEVAQSKSSVASNSRNSERGGLGVHKHVAGPKSYEQIQYEMEEELGRPVSVGEVFVRTHTKADGTFVDQKAKQICEMYDKNVEDRLAQLQDDNFDLSDANSVRPELTTQELDAIFLESTIPDSRGKMYELSSMERRFVKDKRSGASSSYISMAQLRDQLEAAHRKIEEQAAENEHHRAKAEEAMKVAEEAKEVAQQSQVTVASLEMLVAYMQKDPGYARFLESQSHNPSTSTPSAQPPPENQTDFLDND